MALVTVLITSYNPGGYLKPAMESICTQDFHDWEMVFVDDCSSDGSVELVRALAGKDRRIRLYCNERNLGPGGSSNRGLEQVRTPWIARMDADDLSVPGRLGIQAKEASLHPGATFLTSYLDVFDTSGRRTPGARGVGNDFDLLGWFLLFYNRVGGHGQTWIRTEVLRAVGGYDPSKFPSEDRALWPVLLEKGTAVLTRQVLYLYRKHSASLMGSLKTRYSEGSLRAGQETVRRWCGVELAHADAVLLRDFWMRFDDGSQDWDRAQRLLLDLAGRFRGPHSFAGGVGRLRGTLAEGWLANALRAARRKDGGGCRAHLRRAGEASGAPAPFFRFAWRLARVGFEADRLL